MSNQTTKKMSRLYVIAFFSAIIISTILSQSNVPFAQAAGATWARTYGDGIGNTVGPATDGGFIIAGQGPILKLDSQGDLEWAKGIDDFSGTWARQTSDAGYVVLGRVIDHDLIVKLDSDGNLEWSKSNIPRIGFLSALEQTSDGGYIAVGHTVSGFVTTSSEAWVVKLDSDGNFEWDKAYGGAEHDLAHSIQQTSDGGYIVGGRTESFNIDQNEEFWLLKLDSDGSIEWEKVFGDGVVTSSVQQTLDGGYIAAGSTSMGSGDGDIWLLKLDSDGEIEWEKAYGGAGTEDGHLVQQTSDGGYIAVGETHSFGSGNRLWVLRLDSDGNAENCIDTDLIQETSATVEETFAQTDDTETGFHNSTATIENLETDLDDADVSVAAQCGPMPEYSLMLFENTDDVSDGVIGLDQEVRAVAGTVDASVDQVTFRWIAPDAGIAREITVTIASPEDSFVPNVSGTWIVEAGFGNGQTIQKMLDISFFVLPESPIGAIAMAAASISILGAFLFLRMNKKPVTGFK